MAKDIFDVITEYAVNESMNGVLLQNGEYKQIQAKIDSLTDELDKFMLPKEQMVLIDRLISSYIENGALYGRMTYQQGMRDCCAVGEDGIDCIRRWQLDNKVMRKGDEQKWTQ